MVEENKNNDKSAVQELMQAEEAFLKEHEGLKPADPRLRAIEDVAEEALTMSQLRLVKKFEDSAPGKWENSGKVRAREESTLAEVQDRINARLSGMPGYREAMKGARSHLNMLIELRKKVGLFDPITAQSSAAFMMGQFASRYRA